MRIYLSGAEASPHALMAMAYRPARCILTSFFYRTKHRKEDAMWVRFMVAAKYRMADSGAFSFLYGSGGVIDFDKYLDEYTVWLRQNVRAGMLDNWIELDLSQRVGYAWVHAQRTKLVAGGLGAGLINVWHSDADWDYWLYLLREAAEPGRSGFVAIEGHHDDRDPLDYARFIAEAYRVGVRVHGFMITGGSDLERYPFFSVDSTSWQATTRYGGTQSLSRKNVGVRLRHDGRVSRNPDMGDRVRYLVENLGQWAEVEQRATRMWISRGVDWSTATGHEC